MCRCRRMLSETLRHVLHIRPHGIDEFPRDHEQAMQIAGQRRIGPQILGCELLQHSANLVRVVGDRFQIRDAAYKIAGAWVHVGILHRR